MALFQSQKLEAIGQLTGGIAHDFNNLLMAILGSLELVRKRLPEDPRISPLIDNAIKGAHRGATLTQRMLAFARRQDLRPVAVELPELVQDMSGLLRQSVGTEVAVETRFPLGLPAVLTDPNQLESALLNLAVNARDAMPHGGNIVISAREEVLAASTGGLKDGRYVCLSIADTGEGMNEVTLSRAAEPFFTTKGVGKGTGLGLPMVYGLAQQSGGQLVLKSREGEGTTAELWLPVAASERAGAQALALPQAADLQPAARPLVILAVDDDPLVLMNTAALLEDLGHTVLAAGSGEEALSIARDMAIDVVVTDHVMPGMDGLQLAHVLRQARPDLPTVLATGFAELPEDAGAGIPRLAKPFSQAELSEAIVRAAGEAAPPLLRAG